MALTPIRGTIINLEDVFVSTEDGTRYVTDRFSLWRLDELAGRSKLVDALAAVQDGCYTMTAGGAVRPNKMFSSVPTCARLIPEGAEDGDKLERMPITLDYKRDGAQLWRADDGGLVMFDSRFDLSGYVVRRHPSGRNERPVSVFTPRGSFAGMVMPVRIGGEWHEVAVQLAEGLGIVLAPESVAS